jgi:hypothetical protein
MGTLNVYLISVPAVVVVFDDVNGVFQDVSITPSQGSSTTSTTSTTGPPTTSKAGPPTSPTSGLTTTPTTGGLSPIAASQPGSGWGGN